MVIMGILDKPLSIHYRKGMKWVIIANNYNLLEILYFLPTLNPLFSKLV
jgi:hypothetical protein